MDTGVITGMIIFVVKFFDPPPPLPFPTVSMLQKAGTLALALRICLIFFLVHLCNGFSITIPPQLQIAAGDVKTFQWTWNLTDSQHSTSGAFVAMLIKPPENFTCQSIGVGGDSETVYKLVESFAVRQNPVPVPAGSQTSGNFALSPKTQGSHFICTYGNVPISMVDQQKQGQGDNFRQDIFTSSASDVFQVTPNATASSSPEPSATSSPQPSATDPRSFNWWNHNIDPIAALVGGILGALALVFLTLAIIFYRRLRYQRKLNQFHKEHMLLLQQPPQSRLSSHTVTRLADEAATVAPLSPISKKRSMTMQKGNSYQFVSSDAPQGSFSPPMYSVALPNEPTSMYGYSDNTTETGRQST
ncbi:hypothetical protein L218DRAFT_1002649 [Marasmius fiardii PR-910]|nr:hypothetical protein L218DRAFT_1002649 [Marasmius fiardii PR-910]